MRRSAFAPVPALAAQISPAYVSAQDETPAQTEGCTRSRRLPPVTHAAILTAARTRKSTKRTYLSSKSLMGTLYQSIWRVNIVKAFRSPRRGSVVLYSITL